MAKAKKVKRRMIGPAPARRAKRKVQARDPKADFDKPVRKKPRQARLPGMEDSPIKDLEDGALEHSECLSEIRVKRAEIKKIKIRLATLMRKMGKKTYNHAGIALKLREGEDDVSVQVKRHHREQIEEQEEDDDTPDAIGGEDEQTQ